MIRRLLLTGLVFTFMIGCQKASDPVATLGTGSQSYGSSKVTLPSLGDLGLAKKSLSPVQFQLLIKGPGMDSMFYSWDLGAAETTIVVTKIPAGDGRIFTGTILDQSGNVAYEGSSTVSVYSGQCAEVYLRLSKVSSGSANIHVIIDGQPRYPSMLGCFNLFGSMQDSMGLNGLMVNFWSQQDSAVIGYIYQYGQMAGKLYGIINDNATFYWYWSTPTEMRTVRGSISPDGNSFRGMVFQWGDTTQTIGGIIGYRGYCDTVPPNPSPCGAPIVINSPVEGRIYYAGYNDSVEIRWCADTSLMNQVTISYSNDYGATWKHVTPWAIPASQGYYIWPLQQILRDTVSGGADTLYQIRISSYEGTYQATSGYFTIRQQQPWPPYVDSCLVSPLRVTYPTWGNVYRVGDSLAIQWCGNAVDSMGNLFVELSTDGGNTWTAVGNSTIPAYYRYALIQPLTQAMVSNNCQIRISDYANSWRRAVSGIFSIVRDTVVPPVYGQVHVIAPNGFESYKIGDTMHIQFRADTGIGIPNYMVSLSLDSGATWHMIDTGLTVWDGSVMNYPWVIPATIGGVSTVSRKCLIRISQVYNDFIQDISDNIFTIARRTRK